MYFMRTARKKTSWELVVVDCESGSSRAVLRRDKDHHALSLLEGYGASLRTILCAIREESLFANDHLLECWTFYSKPQHTG